ncbi:MAG: ribosome maturation factor RimM [Bryobacterales bacterium]|nr:ribosome maturation factor RimM [Bryobacteraceae bacterium]MDW8355214.1 ribosome maturation factor RimM [Bryobacterales bacterium]
MAVLIRPWGNRGELIATALTSRSERLQAVREIFLFPRDAELGRSVRIERVWEHRGRLVFKFHGVDTIEQAEALRGAEVRLPLSERPELPPGEYYHSDLIGCEVIERSSGESLGQVAGWEEYGGPPLLRVVGAGAGRELLIPFARSICVEIDLPQRRILVDLPEGLKELE